MNFIYTVRLYLVLLSFSFLLTVIGISARDITTSPCPSQTEYDNHLPELEYI